MFGNQVKAWFEINSRRIDKETREDIKKLFKEKLGLTAKADPYNGKKADDIFLLFCPYDSVDEKSEYGCKKDFVEQNPEAVKMFLKEYEASINLANSDIENTSALCEQYGIIPKAAVAKKAIPNCNITYIAGADMKASVLANLQIFFDANPKSIGGKLPGDDFYYGA